MKKLLLTIGVLSSLFGFNIQMNEPSQNVVSGKVVKAYHSIGFGRMGREWLFMDVKTENGIQQVAIAPTFVISNLSINEGDEVKVDGFRPPMWGGNAIKAIDIYDVTQKKDYPISMVR